MLRLIVARLSVSLATLLAVSVVIFAGVSVLPGNAAEVFLGQGATHQQVVALDRQFGLDRPITQRYLDWLSGLLRGNLSKSLTANVQVSTLIGPDLRNTAALALGAFILLLVGSVSLGVLSALWRETWFDYTVATTSLTLLSTPEFVVGTALIAILATGLGLLPPVSLLESSKSLFSQTSLLILPVLTLALVGTGWATRMIRASMIEILSQDYIQAAVLRGVPRWRILLRHALPNAFDSTAQILALMVGWLVGGVVITETLFTFPGIGSEFVSSVTGRDLPTIEAVAMIVTTVYVLANLCAEIGIIVMNPRLRRAHR